MENFEENKEKIFITIKYAQSLDGKIATSSGDSKWISNNEALYFAHKLRMEHDAILIGINTLILDNPELNVRLKENISNKQPIRIILDKNLKIFSNDYKKLKLLKTYKNINTIIFYDKKILEDLSIIEKLDFSKNMEYMKNFNIKFISVNSKNDFLDIKEIINILYIDFKIKNLLVEGGGKIITNFLINNLFNKIFVITAPIFIGNDGIASIGNLNFSSMEKVKSMQKMKFVKYFSFNDQIVYEFEKK